MRLFRHRKTDEEKDKEIKELKHKLENDRITFLRVLKSKMPDGVGKQFAHIEVVGKDEIIIYTNKPGILIGKGGSTFDEILKYYKKNYGINKISIKETKFLISNCGLYY